MSCFFGGASINRAALTASHLILTGCHDVIYGGLGDDFLPGGAGDDYLRADDNLETNGGLNNVTDGAEFADADFAYGAGATTC